MSRVEIEFNDKEETSLSLPLWLVDGEELYQVIYVNNGYILFDQSDSVEGASYIHYDSIQEVLEYYPTLRPVDVKIIVSQNP